MEKRTTSLLDVLKVMGRDAQSTPSNCAIDISKEISESFKFIREGVYNLPNNAANLGRSTIDGYLSQQIQTSANSHFIDYINYRSKRESIIDSPRNFVGGLFGSFIGATQDTATLAGTYLYFVRDVNHPATKAAVVLLGAKAVSNVASRLLKWYQSARDRTQDKEK